MPAPERPVIVDTTPIIVLSLVDRLELFRELYGRVVIPPAVRGELLAGPSHEPGSVSLTTSPWIEATDLSDPRRADLLSDLDRGEAEVIALAQESGARLVIMDERLGRLHVRRLGLPLTGSVGVFLRAKEEGLLPEIGPVLVTLRERGIYLGEALVEEALRSAGE